MALVMDDAEQEDVRVAAVTSCLFVTRKFPPSTGGMETLAAEVWSVLDEHLPNPKLIASGRHSAHLGWWLGAALARTGVLLSRRQVKVVLAGDALMYMALRPLLKVAGVRSVALVHGLDLTWPWFGYRWLVRRAVRHADCVVAVSEATATVARDAGVAADRIQVIRPGLPFPTVTQEDRLEARKQLVKQLDEDPTSFFLLTLGRVVRRKGARWFVHEVLPRLPEHVVYLVAGDGPDCEAVAAAAEAAGVAHRVRLLGRVDDEMRETLMRGADLFVQPNIVVADDMEGFGLVIIEAALRGTPVIGADLEGIKDAVVDGETGLLCPSGDADAWARVIMDHMDGEQLAFMGQRFAMAAAARYGRDRMAADWVRVLADGGAESR